MGLPRGNHDKTRRHGVPPFEGTAAEEPQLHIRRASVGSVIPVDGIW